MLYHVAANASIPIVCPRDAECAGKLAKRTLTNLYNERPAWLDLAHKKLDEAVLAAYGWEASIADDEILARLLELNLARAKAEEQQHPQAAPARYRYRPATIVRDEN